VKDGSCACVTDRFDRARLLRRRVGTGLSPKKVAAGGLRPASAVARIPIHVRMTNVHHRHGKARHQQTWPGAFAPSQVGEGRPRGGRASKGRRNLRCACPARHSARPFAQWSESSKRSLLCALKLSVKRRTWKPWPSLTVQSSSSVPLPLTLPRLLMFPLPLPLPATTQRTQ